MSATADAGDGPTLLDVYSQQIRLESKVEHMIGLLTAVRDQLTDHEARLRALESETSGSTSAQKALTEAIADHEKRLRAMETWARALPVSTLIALIAAVASIVSVVVGR